jgi:protein phosphatase
VEAAVIQRQRLWNNRKGERGPFDIIGDVRGCGDELGELLDKLGYSKGGDPVWAHPHGRKAIFVGDLVDRGPRIVDTLKLVMAMVEAGSALALPGNHDMKLKRKLESRNVPITRGLDRSLEELERETPELRDKVRTFLDGTGSQASGRLRLENSHSESRGSNGS